MRVLSLGAGVQSSTLLLMSCSGVLPKLDAAIFADTQWEPQAVYDHLEWLKVYADQFGIPIYTVGNGNIKADMEIARTNDSGEYNGRWVSMPLFVRGDGIDGMIRRQCTREYKIDPINKKIRELAGYKPRQRIPDGTIEQWLGISTDELGRAKVSEKGWIDFHYPLIVDLKYSRGDCLKWLEDNYPGRSVPRSACIGCPFHSDQEWRGMKDNNPSEWLDAVSFDKQIRKAAGMKGDSFLHRSCVPLDEADINGDQQDLWGDECAGVCGV